jgi:flagellar basal-body rod modification protein FlgD
MTDVTSAVAGTSTAQSSVTSSAKSVITSDFETFIKMLTTQAKYQDPLEPLDSTEYSAQLAQFSMVEQQVQGNNLLESMAAQLGMSNMAALSSWVGMEARAVAPAAFDGVNPVTVAPNPPALADSVKMDVKNEAGTIVNTITLPVSAEAYQWDGTDADGSPVAAGNYTFEIRSYDTLGELALSEQAEVYTRVSETQMVGGEVVLITGSGQAILASSVTALREPQA